MSEEDILFDYVIRLWTDTFMWVGSQGKRKRSLR